MKKVLIVLQGSKELPTGWHRELDDKVKVISAFSNGEAVVKFASNLDVDAIAVDTCSEDIMVAWSLFALVRMFRSAFGGPIIPISALGCYRQHLLDAGCNDYECSCASLPQRILEILGP